MNNNDILRRVRYTFDFSDSKMMAIFALGNLNVTREQVSDWLKKDDDPAFKKCNDMQLASFLNGFITDRRGKKEGVELKPEKKINNNIVLKKLKIALDLKSEDMAEIMEQSDVTIGKNELSAFFRTPEHKNYRECKDQFLRNFLNGMQLKYHDSSK